jgi:gamma-polyglutamate biosynthesis protein CapA
MTDLKSPLSSPSITPSVSPENAEQKPQHSMLKVWLGVLVVLIIGVSSYLLLSTKQQPVPQENNLTEVSQLESLDVVETEDTTPHLEENQEAPLVVTETPPSPEPVASAQVTLLFAGDMMFDRNIRMKMQTKGTRFVLQDLEETFKAHDFVIANLEGPITDKPSRSVGSTPGSTNNFLFTFQPEIAQTLYDQNVRIVNLGNNHILNFGVAGAKQTKEYLKTANVQFFGDTSLETTSQERTLVIEKEGIKIGFVNYNQFTTGGLEHALTDLKWLKPQVDITVVYTHWGNEYVPVAKPPITTTAHQFVDEGANLIIGMHPHVIQNVEMYKDVRIYYSLGNFVFDQYFSPEVQQAMIVSVTIDPQTKLMTFAEQNVKLNKDGSTTLIREE